MVGLTIAATVRGAGVEESRVNVTGTVSFEVATNVFGTKVRGKSRDLLGTADLREHDAGLSLERLEAVVAVSTLKTGIGLRDEHMRRYIFETTGAGQPEVRFSADHADCPRAGASFTCAASGTLTIRGLPRPFSIALDVARDGDQFRVRGTSTIALSTWGIDRPSQLGVRTDDAVTIHLDASARRAIPTSAQRR